MASSQKLLTPAFLFTLVLSVLGATNLCNAQATPPAPKTGVVAAAGPDPGAATRGPWLKVRNPEPGDVVVLRMELKIPTHVGIVVSRDKFLQILEKIHACAERLSNPMWCRCIVGFYRWAG